MLNRITACLSALALAASFGPAALSQGAPANKAAPAAPAALTAAERKQILNDAAKALVAVKTARGTFEQVAPDASLSTGRFALSRPGKMRFEYDAPVALLLVSDGTTVALQDTELETTERVPLGSTPLALLLDDKIDFEKKAKVTDVRRLKDDIAISLTDPKGKVDGTLTLFLSNKTRALTGWRTVDGTGQATSVKLTVQESGKKLNPRLFIVQDLKRK
jgi:outer membrane lipoprotein-sorting protein